MIIFNVLNTIFSNLVIAISWLVRLYAELHVIDELLAIGLSYVQVDKHGTWVTIMYTTYISGDLAHHEIFHAKSGKAGIISFFCMMKNCCWCFLVIFHWLLPFIQSIVHLMLNR